MRTLFIGLDAFDPRVFERLAEKGKLPNLARYAEAGGYSRFSVSNPPQSEVSWTSIATGLNPGGHGVFDFVHRDPGAYTPYVSLLPTKQNFVGTQFVPPHKARTIFDQATERGFPATVLWWPATFPARPESPVRTLPGLGTPDIQGRWGVGVEFSTDPEATRRSGRKTPLLSLERRGKGRYTGSLPGPAQKKRGKTAAVTLDLQLEITDDRAARLSIDKTSVELREGEWSPILELTFKVGFLASVKALTRVVLTQIQPDLKLYFLPLQLHPLHSPWRYGTPGSFVKEVWKTNGPFLSLGWPQDTTGLEDGCIDDNQFLQLCDSIFTTRKQILMQQLQNFDDGILASVFDTLDRVQHMFWRDRPDIVDAWYAKLDALIGQVEPQLSRSGAEQTKLVIVSDHGFTDFEYKVHLNRWLLDRSYLSLKGVSATNGLRDVDWGRSKAYAIGLNSIYLNVSGREGKGSVQADQYEAVCDRLCEDLLSWQGPDGSPVVQQAWRQREAFTGPLATYGPDIIVGYTPGYRASSQTGLGKWEQVSVERNDDHWGADHCVAPECVPGVLFSNQDLTRFPHPSYQDIPALAIEGTADSGGSVPPPSYNSSEDEEVVEERLKSLGYL